MRLQVPKSLPFSVGQWLWKKYITIDNLIKWNIILMDCVCTYKCNEETSDNLLLHCAVAKD